MYPINLLMLSSILYLESTGRTTTTSPLELASLRPDKGLDTIVGVGVVDGGSLTKVSKGLTASRSTQQDGVGSSGCPQCKLIESDALSSGSNDALACILGEGEGADAHLGAFKHTNIISDLSDNDGNLAILVGHVLGKTVEPNWRRVDLGHVQTLGNGGAEFGVCSAREEFVQLDEETVVGVLRLDDFRRRLVATTASSGFKIDSHV